MKQRTFFQFMKRRYNLIALVANTFFNGDAELEKGQTSICVRTKSQLADRRQTNLDRAGINDILAILTRSLQLLDGQATEAQVECLNNLRCGRNRSASRVQATPNEAEVIKEGGLNDDIGVDSKEEGSNK